MSLRPLALLLVLATVVLAILGDWSGSAFAARLWRLPAGLLLLGLAYEAWRVGRTSLALTVRTPGRWLLGRPTPVGLCLAQEAPRGRARTLSVQLVSGAPPEVAIERRVQHLTIGATKGGRDERDERGVCTLVGTARRLGRWPWPALPARIGGALGLAWWSRTLPAHATLQVVPDCLLPAERSVGLENGGSQPRRRVGAGGEVLQLRDWRSGDALRQLDWKASARRGRLISRDFIEDQHLQILVAVDVGSASAWRAGEVDRLALYANVASRFAQRAVAFDDRVGLLLYAERPLVALAPAAGVAAVARLRACLSEARSVPVESNALLAANRLRSLLRHRGLVVLLTHLDEPAAFAPLAAAARLLLPKHLPIIAGVASSEAARLAMQPVGDAQQAYGALAAQEYVAGMARNVRALRSLGARTLLCGPERLDAMLLREYLRLRERRQVG